MSSADIPVRVQSVLLLQGRPRVSLELEENRTLFLAMLNGFIRLEWFRGALFFPDLGESLALLLSNQRDRFMLHYYDAYDHSQPHSQAVTPQYVL